MGFIVGRRLAASLAGAALAAVITVSVGLAQTGATNPGNAKAGATVFKTQCITCHTLKAAKSVGTIGPNLDKKKPAYALIITRVTKGKGTMPGYGTSGLLTKKQIQNVAAYVFSSTHPK
jgi:mono/diheme cytochrome c family protein